MIKIKQLLFALMCVWIFSSPAWANALPAPKLSIIHRTNDIDLNFQWQQPVEFKEEIKEDNYKISFLTDVLNSPTALSQILMALPIAFQKMQLDIVNNQLVYSVNLPPDYYAKATAMGSQISVKLSKKQSLLSKILPTNGLFKKSTKTKTDETKLKNKETNPKLKPKDILPPVPQIDSDLSLSLSSPQSFFKKQKIKKEQKQIDKGYRAASLSFPWDRATALAAFKRDGYVWIVFDRKGQFDFSVELELYKDIILEMIEVPHSTVTIYRMVTAKGYNPSVRREGLLWIVDLMYQPLFAKSEVDLYVQRKSPFGPRIIVPLAEDPTVLSLIDPEMGDLMHIVPVFSTGKGVKNLRSYVDVSFLPTAQGVVIIPNAEGVDVVSSTSGLDVRGPEGGMRFSSEDVASFLARSVAHRNPKNQILEVELWASNKPETYLSELNKKQAEVLDASKENKDSKRMELARFYFANGMYPETLSILDFLESKKSNVSKWAGFVALKGASNFMMRRYKEAQESFDSKLLKGVDSVAFWRAANLAATASKPGEYLPAMKDNMAILQAYPQLIKTPLSLAGLHAAVDVNDEFAIQNFMESAMNSQNTDAQNDEISYYYALWQDQNGMYAIARDEMKKLAGGDNLYFRAVAGLETVRLQQKLNRISPEERIKELGRLSYAWRGGDFEYNLMLLLARTHQERKDYFEMLHILNEMQTRFQDSKEVENISKMMVDMFQKIYLGDEQDNMSPVKAIALYNEFKDLVPEGENGSKIVRKLADRLVSIDLLDTAATLLEDHLTQKIPDSERKLILTRLALIRLLNKEPEKAIAALDASQKEAYSEKLLKQRLYIRAKALADLKKPEEAAKLLEEDDSKQARMLRAEIFWQAQMWGEAADAIRFLIDRPEPNKPLSDEQAQNVLNWAAALRLAGRPKVVVRLRENFQPYMKKTKLAEAFDFITTTTRQGILPYHQIAKEIDSVESFQSFAKDYTNMIKEKGLSEAVK